MRAVFLASTLFLGSLFASVEIDALVERVLKSNGLDPKIVRVVKDPFEKPPRREGNFTPPPEPEFFLKAVFEKSALINDKWRKLGSTVEGYEVYDIKEHSVVMYNKKKQKKLLLFKGKR